MLGEKPDESFKTIVDLAKAKKLLFLALEQMSPDSCKDCIYNGVENKFDGDRNNCSKPCTWIHEQEVRELLGDSYDPKYWDCIEYRGENSENSSR